MPTKKSKSPIRRTAALSDYSRRQGGAALGARLRRLSERIDREATQVYAERGVVFEQRWMGALNLLNRHGPLSVNELATALGISHPSVSQTRSSLRAARLVVERADPDDGRRRTLHLTPKGKAQIETLQPIWSALAHAAEALNTEAGNVVVALTRLEKALDRQSLFDRANSRLAEDT